jgi:hypothetical protein
LIKGEEKMKRSLSKVMMVLALGGIMTMPCIISCKKENPNGFSSQQIYAGPFPSNQRVNGGQVPLPSTLLLLGSGLAGMGLLGWRKRKNP